MIAIYDGINTINIPVQHWNILALYKQDFPDQPFKLVYFTINDLVNVNQQDYKNLEYSVRLLKLCLYLNNDIAVTEIKYFITLELEKKNINDIIDKFKFIDFNEFKEKCNWISNLSDYH